MNNLLPVPSDPHSVDVVEIGRLSADIRVVDASGIAAATEADVNTVSTIRRMGYQLAANLSTLTVSEDGYYAFVFSVPSGYVGMNMDNLSVFAKTLSFASRVNASSLSASAVGDVTEGYLFDNMGRKASTATQELIAVTHLEANSSAGTYFGSKVIPAEGLPELGISTVELTDELRSNLQESLSFDVSLLRTITDENLRAPVEPSQTLVDEVKSENYELQYKLDSIVVSEDGYYIFAIDVPAELMNLSSSDVRVFVVNQGGTSGSEIQPTFITGLISVIELDALGLKLDTIGAKILVIGLLNAGTPLSVYLGKILLMLLLGGCETGAASYTGYGLIALAGVVFMLASAKFLKRK